MAKAGGKSGRIFRKTRQQLRALYLKTWGRDWPEDDDYLDVLWRQVRDETPRTELGNYRIPNTEMLEKCVMVMRENHVFQVTGERTVNTPQ